MGFVDLFLSEQPISIAFAINKKLGYFYVKHVILFGKKNNIIN